MNLCQYYRVEAMVNGFDEVFEESDGHPLEHITSSTAASAPVPTGDFEANNPSTPEDSRLPEVVELWDPSRRRFAIPFQRSRSREVAISFHSLAIEVLRCSKGFKAYISEIGLSAGVRESIRQDRFSFVDHRNRHIPTPAWKELVVPGSVVKLEIPDNEFYYNSERPARVSHYKSLAYGYCIQTFVLRPQKILNLK